MKKLLSGLCLLAAACLSHQASAEVLDFSSGQYDASNTLYREDGFTVQASNGFHSVRLGTLAWYRADSVITISDGGTLFDFTHLYVVGSPYAGLVFESSRGASLSVGNVSGPLDFTGPDWQSISFLKIHTSSDFDILTQVDNVTVTPVPEPTSAALMSLGLGALAINSLMGRQRKRLHGTA